MKNERNHLIVKIVTSVLFALVILLVIFFSGCTEADKVSYNVAKEADNFNVYRHVVIINTRTDKVEFELVGKMSVNISDGRLDCVVEDGGRYYKHIINLTQNNMYVIEDLGGADVSKYKYEINYIPEFPFTVTQSD